MVFTFSNNKVLSLSESEFSQKFSETPDAVIIDVRTAGEFADGHILNALNIDVSSADFASRISQLDADKSYFVYCRSGGRSGMAVGMMQKMGFKNIYELQRGLLSSPNLVLEK